MSDTDITTPGTELTTLAETYGEISGGDMAVVVDTATAAVEPHVLDPNEVYAITAPRGATVVLADVERYLDAPKHKRGTVTLYTGLSLATYVNEHASAPDDAATALFADIEAREIVGILNGHGTAPGWGDHRAVLALRHTPQWKRWLARDGQLGDQVAFATHLEDNLLDVISPPGAELLELAQTFQAHTKVAFRSSRMLDSGQNQLTYEETIDARAGQTGQITIPREFEIALAPFEGLDKYRVTARLRYRLRDGALSIGYVLFAPEDVVRTAFDDVLAQVEADTGLTAYRGQAPAASR